MMRLTAYASLAVFVALHTPARAVDHAVLGRKLVVVDKTASAGQAKVVFASTDAGVTKGAGTNPAQISATVTILYGSSLGQFDVPAGSNWVVNDSPVAKYTNPLAPAGGSAKVVAVKPGKSLKIVGKNLGDTPLDVSAPPASPVVLGDAPAWVAFAVTNEGQTHRHCTRFLVCTHKVIAAGTGYKLVCKGTPPGDSSFNDGYPDPRCEAVPGCGPERYVDLGATVLDTCAGLEWEKKDGADDGTPGDDVPNLANPHDVDNTYAWAGQCSLIADKLCQPDAAAVATCAAAAGNVSGCELCGPGEGTCTTSAPTIWEWVNQLNASSFAGHADWRIATSGGCPACALWTGQAAELESLVDRTQGVCSGGSGVCTDPVLGPVGGPPFVGPPYWSASQGPEPQSAWTVFYTFAIANSEVEAKFSAGFVRAVRTTP